MKKLIILFILSILSLGAWSQPPVLESIKSLDKDMLNYITWEDQVVEVSFTTSVNLSYYTPAQMETAILTDFASRYPADTSNFAVEVIFLNSREGLWRLFFGKNVTRQIKRWTFSAGTSSFFLIQSRYRRLFLFSLTGDELIPEGGSVSLRLAHTQAGVTYKLFKDGDVKLVLTGTGSKLTIPGITSPGTYTMTASHAGITVPMNGSVSVRFANPLTIYLFSGEKTSFDGAMASLTLSGSDLNVQYRLLKNGTARETKAGTGSPLVFRTNEAGTYTVEAFTSDHDRLMSGSVTLEAVTGPRFTTSRNHDIVHAYLDPTTTVATARRVTDVTYLDGLGRPMQQVLLNASPDGSDIVRPFRHGAFGREEKSYLPFSRNNNGGGFVADDLSPGNWAGDRGTTEAAFAHAITTFDDSPLNRVIKQVGAGKNWHQNDKGVTYAYRTNAANEVRLWRVDAAGVLTSPGFYAAGTLTKTVVTGEDGNKTEEFKDRAGNTVASVMHAGTVAHRTGNVYDDKGQLRLVIPPAAGDNSSLAAAEIDRWCYRYAYDDRGRLVEKQLPGVAVVYMVYDAKDRLVLSQDGNQRPANKWLYNLHDGFNRVIETGECVIGGTVTSLRATVGASASYVPASKTPLLYHYHDDYSFTGVQAFVPGKHISGYTDDDGIPNGYFDFVSGQQTGSRVKVLDDAGTSWITVTTYHDDRLQPVQVIRSLYPSGTSVTAYRYDFTGNVLEEKEWQTVNNVETMISRKYAYDNRGRLLSTKLKVNNDPEITLAEMVYDGLGRIASKKYHGGIETSTYTYNVRDWLTGITGGKFSEELRYETSREGMNDEVRYNGNISSTRWNTGNGWQGLGYRYDGLNRLTRAIHGQHDVPSVTYDKNGNILSLQRKRGGTVVDNLAYRYDGNRLLNVTDASGQAFGYPATSGSLSGQNYFYDANGNMIQNSHKNISSIQYNFLNLPRQVTTTNGTVKYVYTATGEKLQARYGENNVLTYNGSVVRDGSSSLKYILTGEGRYVMNGVTGTAEYHLADHLGNVRVVLGSTGSVLQKNDYYPFGLLMAQEGSSTNRYLYNGKEEQELTGWLDYGARMYDAAVGRWFNVDPMAEKYYSLSLYSYCGNHVINAIDIGGELFIFVNGFWPGEYIKHIIANAFKDEYDLSMERYIPNRHFHSSDFYGWHGIDKLYMKIYNDKNARYVSGSSDPSSRASERYEEGKKKGVELLEMLSDGRLALSDGETIKLVGYSMGAAFAAGMSDVISRHETYGKLIEFVDYLAPYQPEQFKHPDKILGRQFQMKGDWLVGAKKIEGIDELNFFLKNNKWYENALGGHVLNNSFMNFLQSCINAGVPIYVK